MVAADGEKAFYQGILQMAVALYHLGNHNWRGAAILMGEGVNRLRGYEPEHRGVDVTALVDQGLSWLGALQRLGPEQVEILSQALTQAQANGEAAAPAAVSLSPLDMSLPTPWIRTL